MVSFYFQSYKAIAPLGLVGLFELLSSNQDSRFQNLNHLPSFIYHPVATQA
jgi:hypothetical protein